MLTNLNTIADQASFLDTLFNFLGRIGVRYRLELQVLND
jgi:hypothetical protein